MLIIAASLRLRYSESLGYTLVFLTFQVVEDGYEFFAKRQLVTLFSAPNYCGEFDNAGAMMSVDETLMCSFQVRFELSDLGPFCYMTLVVGKEYKFFFFFFFFL